MVAFSTQSILGQTPDREDDQPRTSATDSEKKGIRFRRVVRKLTGQDPNRLAILGHIRAIWRSLSDDGHFVFFDVQPIAVKAYGGRRYTSELRPVLESKQKTRGMFYLFTAYSATTGRVYWSFMSGKSSRFVCRFFRKLRRHIPNSELWVMLDRDPAHPIKSKMTKRLFR